MLLAIFAAGSGSDAATAQVADQVYVYGRNPANVHALLLRFDRSLKLLSSTDVHAFGGGLAYDTPMVIAQSGRAWIAFDPLNVKSLLRVHPSGAVAGQVMLQHNPVNVALNGSAGVVAITRIPLNGIGPAYSVSSSGSVLWVNSSGPDEFFLYPFQVTTTSTGQIWIGDVAGPGWGNLNPRLVRIDPATGDVVQTFDPPPVVAESSICRMVPSADGALWMLVCGPGGVNTMMKTDGVSILDSFPVNGGTTGSVWHIAVDAFDRVFVLEWVSVTQGIWGNHLLRYDPKSPAEPYAFEAGGIIRGFALGPEGEDAYVVSAPLAAPLTSRLDRINLRSGVRSSVPLDPVYSNGGMAYGDPTGFVLANAIDQLGDNDGDGYANRVETLAGSNPFNPQSRPNGPKVTISFTPANSIILTYFDPDGLVHPTGGLDLTSLSLTAGPFGEVFPFLMSFLNLVDVQPDGKTASAVFGGLPLPSGLKLQLEATVADLTGATGWDWQVTPPGDL